MRTPKAIQIKNYLDVNEVVAAAVDCGASAVHPGYGFLSENPALVEALHTKGIAFIGPAASALRIFGDKVQTRR